MVRTLASVNQLWRELVLSQRYLFSSPDWSDWTHDLLELWCSRARGFPLDVRLDDGDISFIAERDQDPWLDLFQSTKPTWGSLYYRSGRGGRGIHSDVEEEIVEAASWIFKDTLPALQ